MMGINKITQSFNWLLLLISVLLWQNVSGDGGPKPYSIDQGPTLTPSISNAPDAMNVIQASPEVHIIDSSCNQTIMEHSFGMSYGKPFVGEYNPPNCKFNRVVLTFKVKSKGRQFDRYVLSHIII
jgi:hypothetical protein